MRSRENPHLKSKRKMSAMNICDENGIIKTSKKFLFDQAYLDSMARASTILT